MADAKVELTHLPAGWQQVLNSGGVRGLLREQGFDAAGRMGSWGYFRSFTATQFSYGPRPAVAVFAHKYPDPIRQKIANHLLEGAM